MFGNTEFPRHRRFSQALILATGELRLGQGRFRAGCVATPRRLLLPALSFFDDPFAPIGRRPSGARLYHRGSRFGPPERRRLDRNLIARILFLAEALDRRTRAKGQHGGVLKAKGLDVLRALLRRFYSHRTGECFPSYDAIAEAAGCCRATVAVKLAILAELGIIEAIRRKVVATFTSAAHRVRFDVAVQTSNSYLFNIALVDRPQNGDLALPLFRPASEAGSKNWFETSPALKNTLPPELAAALERLGHAIDGADRGG